MRAFENDIEVIDELTEWTATEVTGLPIERLIEIDYALKRVRDLLSTASSVFKEGVAQKYGAPQLGSKTVVDGEKKVTISVAKTVKWDEKILSSLVSQLGPAWPDYVSQKYDFPESRYASLPEHIQKFFEPARTVKPGSMTITFK